MNHPATSTLTSAADAATDRSRAHGTPADTLRAAGECATLAALGVTPPLTHPAAVTLADAVHQHPDAATATATALRVLRHHAAATAAARAAATAPADAHTTAALTDHARVLHLTTARAARMLVDAANTLTGAVADGATLTGATNACERAAHAIQALTSALTAATRDLLTTADATHADVIRAAATARATAYGVNADALADADAYGVTLDPTIRVALAAERAARERAMYAEEVRTSATA